MSCKPLKKITEPISLEVELIYQYDRLRLIFNNDEKHEFVKGFKYCMDIILYKIEKDEMQKLQE